MGIVAVIFLVLIFVIVAIVGWSVTIYNNLVALKNNIDKSWSNIDIILKQRHDELTKLLDTCKGYMTHEKDLLTNIARARSSFDNSSNLDDKIKAENALNSGIKGLLALAEAYPDLKANQNFLDLQDRISTIEETIADRREFFNESVNVYNIQIQSIPDMFFASMLAYTKHPLLEIPKDEITDVKVQF